MYRLLSLGLLALGLSTPAAAAPAFPINLELEFCWDGAGCGTTGLTLSADRSFYTGNGASGVWRFVGGPTLQMLFDGGTMYWGSPVPGTPCAAGEMESAGGSHGTWTACL